MKRLVIPLLAAWAGSGLLPARAGSLAFDQSGAGTPAPAASVAADSPLIWTGERMPAPSDGEPLRNGIAMADDVAMVGDGGQQVHVYRKIAGHWVEQQTLVSGQPYDPEAGFAFGATIALSGSRAAIGQTFGLNGVALAPPDPAPGTGSDRQPAAYVFEERDGIWQETARLVPDDGAPGSWGLHHDTFATSLAIDGDTVAVGAYLNTPDAHHANQGAVYVFSDDGSGWRQTQKLVADDGSPGDQFGSAIALQGDTLLIGAHHATRNRDFPLHGLVYVFERRNGVWTQRQTLFPNEMKTISRFGHSLALDGDSAIAGAPRGIAGVLEYGEVLGGVYMLQRSNGLWRVAQALPSLADQGYADSLGDSVALSGDLALAGAWQTFYTGGLVQSGVVHVYERSGDRWVRRGRFTSPEPHDYGYFGPWLALSGRSAIIGSFSGGGEVFAFEARRPAAARVQPGWIHAAVSTGRSEQRSLRIDNPGEETLQLALDPATAIREVSLQPRLTAAIGIGDSRPSGATGVPLDFALDDGGYELATSFGFRYVEQSAVWLNRFAAPLGTGAFTIDGISVLFPTENHGALVGKPIELVAYYDADGDGDPGNAVRLGSAHPATITAEGEFIAFPTDFRVPGDGDVYVGFETSYARGGSVERFPIALDTSAPVFGHSWLASMEDGAPNLDDLSANRVQTFIEDYSTYAARGGNFLIRATGTAPANDCIAPSSVPWLSLGTTAVSVPPGGSTDIGMVLDSAGLAEGSYVATVCLATNDPSRRMLRVPVRLVVQSADTIFGDGFEGTP